MKKYIYLILIVFLIYGCKKYPEDNSSMHLRSVENRIIRAWCFDGHSYGDISINENGGFWSGYGLNNEPFGTFPKYLSIADSKATWELLDHKSNLRIYNPYDYGTYDFTIEKLEKKEGQYYLWLKNDSTTLKLTGEKYQ